MATKKKSATKIPELKFIEADEFPSGTRKSRYDDLAKELKENPGKIAELGPLDGEGSSIATTLRNRGIEAVTRTINGDHFVFAKAPVSSE